LLARDFNLNEYVEFGETPRRLTEGEARDERP
jgi:hypothetical protein